MSVSSGMRRVLIGAAALFCSILVAAGGLIGYGLLQQRNQKETAIQLIELSRMLRDYRKDHRQYPQTEPVPMASIAEFREMAELRDLPLVDSWGNDLEFESDGRDFLLWSKGKNGELDRFTGGGRRKGVDVDLIIYDGKFWQLPHGI